MSTSIGANSSSSSSTSSVFNNTNRVTGLFSNMDTDTIVKNLCSTQQSKIDKASQKETTDQWYETAVSGVEDDVNTFLSTYCSVLGSSSMLKSQTYYVYNVNSDSTDKGASLTASSSASTGTYNVKVDQLAVNSNVASAGTVSAPDCSQISYNNNAELKDLQLANSLNFDADGNISFAINDKTFTFSDSTSLQTMINTINSDTTANVTMTYSRLTDKFTITADSGGLDSSVKIDNFIGNAFGTNSAFQINTGTVYNGINSVAEINGTTITKDSNNFTIDGISYSLNSVTSNPIKFTVSRDYSATTDSISKFVDAYNTLITKLEGLLTAKDYSSDYPPLTKDQQSSMSDTQITAWNTKAKNGILHGNSDLQSLVAGLQETFYSALGGTGENTTSIGIAAGGYFSTDKGKMVVDTDALEKALSETPDTVINMFTNGDSTAESSQQGLIYKIKAVLNTYVSNATDSVKATDTNITNIKSNVKTLNDQLTTMANQYYNKFSAMETALSKLNSESSYISQMFGSSSK